MRPQLTTRRSAHRIRAALEPHCSRRRPPFAFRFRKLSIHDLALMLTLLLSGVDARRINRDLAGILVRHRDGSLIDRGRLLRVAMAGALTGDTRLSIGRRRSLITYLVLLERPVREGPRLAP